MNLLGVLMYRRSEDGKRVRRESMKKGKDYTPFQAKQPYLLRTGIMNCLTQALTKDNLIVLVSPKIKIEDLYVCEECARIHLWKNNAQNVRELSPLEISSMLQDIEMGNIHPANHVKK